MKRVEADASFCGAWILPDESSEAACRRKRLTKAAARSAQDLLGQVPIGLCDVPSAQTGRAILELPLKYDLSAYDSSYLELACRLKLPLRTADKPLRQAAAAELGEVAGL